MPMQHIICHEDHTSLTKVKIKDRNTAHKSDILFEK